MSASAGRDELRLADESDRRLMDDEARLVSEAVKWFDGMKKELSDEDLAIAMYLNAEHCDRLERALAAKEEAIKILAAEVVALKARLPER